MRLSHIRPPSTDFSFLSGLPIDVRRRRKIMTIQAFVDESGGKGQGKHFVMAGLVSESEAWSDFSTEWRDCLQASPSLNIFKMRHAASLSGNFYGWTAEERDEKLRSLARIINKHARFLMWAAIDMDAHANSWAKLKKPHNEAYFWAYYVMIMGLCFDLWDMGWREKFEIIFDEQVVFGLRAKRWYPVVRYLLLDKYPDSGSILPVEPLFRKDDDFLPLQAADLYAWCFRRNSDNPQTPAFTWLINELRNVKQSNYACYYDKHRMKDVMLESKRIVENGEIPNHLMSRYRQIYYGD